MASRIFHAQQWTAIGALALVASSSVQAAPPPFAAGRILVKPAAGLSDTHFADILQRANGHGPRKLKGLGVAVVQVSKGGEKAAIAALKKNRNIEFAELDQLVAPSATSNDPALASQWHLAKMGAPSAWDITLGTGITVAVLDSGVYANHPDLLGKVVVGRNVVAGTVNPLDTSDVVGHGTWVTGVITETANNGIGGASTAPGTQVMPIRITDRSDGYAYFSDMAAGITWAADHGARVANLSYSGAAGSSAVASAASYMMSKNGVVVVAAGNNNTDYGYANSSYLYVAAATDKLDAKAIFSSFGKFVDIAAPGTAIYTTNRSGTYSTVQGTSFSTPNVAGVAAMVMSANPLLKPNDVLAVISSTAVDLGAAGWDANFGHGRVNELAAVQKAVTYQALDSDAPLTAIVSPLGGSKLSGLATVTVSATDASGVKSVNLLVNGAQIASSATAVNNAYTFSWDTTKHADGGYGLSATATDTLGNSVATGTTSVTVNNAPPDTVLPVVKISTPTLGQKISTTASIAASATDNVAVKQLSVFGDGKLLCTGTTTASCSWNLRKAASGSSHTVKVTALDLAGNSASSSVSIVKQ
ncbi:MAG: S8 family serine peptidase [Proteobacteria bacterium]|nr:S8 family serine peptidase [Pseudomonadota bacterium]